MKKLLLFLALLPMYSCQESDDTSIDSKNSGPISERLGCVLTHAHAKFNYSTSEINAYFTHNENGDVIKAEIYNDNSGTPSLTTDFTYAGRKLISAFMRSGVAINNVISEATYTFMYEGDNLKSVKRKESLQGRITEFRLSYNASGEISKLEYLNNDYSVQSTFDGIENKTIYTSDEGRVQTSYEDIKFADGNIVEALIKQYDQDGEEMWTSPREYLYDDKLNPLYMDVALTIATSGLFSFIDGGMPLLHTLNINNEQSMFNEYDYLDNGLLSTVKQSTGVDAYITYTLSYECK